MSRQEVQILRDLAQQVAEIAARPIQDERRDLWRHHNSLRHTRPLVIQRGKQYWREIWPEERLTCQDPFLRGYEDYLRQMIFHDSLGDDTVIEPIVRVSAVRATLSGDCRWGAPIRFIPGTEHGGAGVFDPPIKSEDDIAHIQPQPHRIDEAASAERLAKVQDAIGDILAVRLDRAPMYSGWRADMSTDPARLVGLEQFMLYMLDRPAWLHRVQAILRDGILAQQEQAERAGDWHLFNHDNQSMPYSLEMPDPAEHAEPVSRNQLWGFFASQETTLVSPAMFDEFVLQYQTADHAALRPDRLWLLRGPDAEDRRTAQDPQPAKDRRDSLGERRTLRRADRHRLRRQLAHPTRPRRSAPASTARRSDRLLTTSLKACRGCHVDITYKDVETIRGRSDDLAALIRLTREVAEQCA